MSGSLYQERRVGDQWECMEKEGGRRVAQIQIVKITKKKIEKINKRLNYVHVTSNTIKLK